MTAAKKKPAAKKWEGREFPSIVATCRHGMKELGRKALPVKGGLIMCDVDKFGVWAIQQLAQGNCLEPDQGLLFDDVCHLCEAAKLVEEPTL